MFTELCIGYQTITDSIQVLSHIHFRILLDYNAPLIIWPAWPSGLRRCNFPIVDWRGVGSNPAGDIYFHFESFAPSPFRTGQRSRCKWNQACPFTWSHICFRPQIWFIIQGLVYKYLQYSFKSVVNDNHCIDQNHLTKEPLHMDGAVYQEKKKYRWMFVIQSQETRQGAEVRRSKRHLLAFHGCLCYTEATHLGKNSVKRSSPVTE